MINNISSKSKLFESIFTMIIAILLCVSIYALILSASGTQRTITTEKSDQNDSRTAVAYITTRLRQNDAAGRIHIKQVGYSGNTAIVIKNSDDSWLWIYYDNGFITEYETIYEWDEPTPFDGVALAPVNKLEIKTIYENCITFVINGNNSSISTTIYLKTNVTEL